LLDDSFEFSRESRPVRLFESPARVDSGGGESRTKKWPYQGFGFSVYSSLYPVFFAAAQGGDAAIPFAPYFSAVFRAEGHAGILFTGAYFDHGPRFNYDFNDTFGVYAEATFRFGFGEFTVAEIVEDLLPKDVDAGIGKVSGMGFTLGGGIEVGGRNARFFVGIRYANIFFDSTLNLFDVDIDLPTITLTYFGFDLGIRFYVG
jgi:hypothetical protein